MLDSSSVCKVVKVMKYEEVKGFSAVQGTR